MNPFLCIVDKDDAFGHNREDHEEFELVRSDAKTFLQRLEKTLPDAHHLHEATKRAITVAIQEGYDTSTTEHKMFTPLFIDTKQGILYNSDIYNNMFVKQAIPAMQNRLQEN